MRIHNPAITGSLSISGSGLTIDSIGTFSGSATSTGSFGHAIIADNANVIGRLGIGTTNTSPRKLLILGTDTTNAVAYIYSNAVHTGTDSNSILAVRSDNTSANGSVMNIHNDGSGASLTLNGEGKVMVSGSSTSTGSFAQGFITDKLGIGTTSPAVQLHLSSSVANNFRLERSGASNAAIHFKNASEDWYAGITSAANFSISRNADIASGTEFVIRGNTGNIGIGTSNPNAKLEIKGDGATTGLTFKTIESNNNTTFWVQDGGAVGVHYYPFLINHDHDDSRASNTLFHAKGTTGVGLFVKDAGDVGINTTSPGQGQSTPISDVKLDVLGNQMLSDLSTTNTDQAKLFFFRSDGAVASQGAVPDGLKIGAIEWAALTSGDNNNSISSARIEVEASNTWSSAAVRNADIIFSTVGANALTEKLRITSDNKISGSSTSTGSFGSLVISDKVQSDLTVKNTIKFADNAAFVGSNGEDYIKFEANNKVEIGDPSGAANSLNLIIDDSVPLATLENGSFRIKDGDIYTDEVNGKISGSSTSTGSFGSLIVDGVIQGNNIFGGTITPNVANTDIGSSSNLWQNLWLKNGGRVYFGDTGTYIYGSSTLDVLTFAVGATERFKLDVNSRLSLSNNDAGGTAGKDSTTGNTLFGYGAGGTIDANTINNTFIGHGSGAGSKSDAQYNTAVGTYSLNSLTSGDSNVAMGTLALEDLTAGTLNVAIGASAMAQASTAADKNVAIGANAMDGNWTSANVDGVVAIGYNSLGGVLTTDATATVAIGMESLKALTSGIGNVAIGYQALLVEDDGDHNTAIGYQALKSQTGTSGTVGNTAMGFAAGESVLTGVRNTYIGSNAGQKASGSAADDNTAIGFRSLRVNTSGSRNTSLGAYSVQQMVNARDTVAIGYYTLANALTSTDIDGSVAIGSFSQAENKTGQGNTSVGFETLLSDVNGDFSTAIGYQALKTQNGINGTVANTAIGHHALTRLTSGTMNTAVGVFSQDYNRTGVNNTSVGKESLSQLGHDDSDNNTAVGFQAMRSAGTPNNNDAAQNVAVGSKALTAILDGDNNVAVGYLAGAAITTGEGNNIIGMSAGDALTTGILNTVVGYFALSTSTDVDRVVAIGTEAMESGNVTSDADGSVAIGSKALQVLTSGIGNVAVGSGSMAANATSDFNVAIGTNTLSKLTNDGTTGNTAVGYKALMVMTTGEKNTAVGYESLENCVDGVNNTALGYQSLTADAGNNNVGLGYLALRATTGNQHTAVGAYASHNIGGGANNTSLGFNSLYDIVDGSQNVAIGSQAIGGTLGTTADNSSDLIAIGYQALGGDWGNTTLTDNIAIGTSAMGGAINGAINCIAIGRDTLDGALTTGANGTVGIGTQALKYLTTGASNIAIGFRSLYVHTTGARNIAIGELAMADTNAGSTSLGSADNVFIGYTAGGGTWTDAASNQNIGIGTNVMNGALAGALNNVGIGNAALNSLTSADSNTAIGYLAGNDLTTGHSNVAIGSSALLNSLLVDSTVIIGTGAGAAVMTSDADGTIAIGNSAGAAITSGAGNIAIGLQSLDALTEAADNLAIGFGALTTSSNVNAARNIAIGNYALELLNSDGRDNIAIGYEALETANHADIDGNIAIGNYVLDAVGSAGVWACVGVGYNALTSVNNAGAVGSTAIGYRTLTTLTSGAGNTAVGFESLKSENDGSRNTAIGYKALTALNTSAGNGQTTAVGFEAGMDASTGINNTFVGSRAGNQGTNDITTGDNNTLIGMEAIASAASASNQTVIGASAVGQANNSVVLGNASVDRVYAAQDGAAVLYANGTINTSDRRFKENINDSDLGLEFINKVRPVKYNFKEDKHDGKTKYGIIAQEVLEVLKNSNNEDSSFIETDNSDKLGADYIQFIAPLIKSVQELTEMVKAQQKEIEELKNK